MLTIWSIACHGEVEGHETRRSAAARRRAAPTPKTRKPLLGDRRVDDAVSGRTPRAGPLAHLVGALVLRDFPRPSGTRKGPRRISSAMASRQGFAPRVWGRGSARCISGLGGDRWPRPVFAAGVLAAARCRRFSAFRFGLGGLRRALPSVRRAPRRLPRHRRGRHGDRRVHRDVSRCPRAPGSGRATPSSTAFDFHGGLVGFRSRARMSPAFTLSPLAFSPFREACPRSWSGRSAGASEPAWTCGALLTPSTRTSV